jgi:SSS family solute:Na+ symporter
MPTFDASALDYAIIAIYFVTVLGVGFLARRLIKSDLDFFLSGRALPAWITGLAFIAANLGALEILGMAANGAQYSRPSTSTGSARSRPWSSSPW